jgi:hypothetical protein
VCARPAIGAKNAAVPVYAVRTMNYGTASYLQPQSIPNGRVFQLGAILKF